MVASGCAREATPSHVERIDSAGVTIVRSSGPDRPLDWSVQEVLRVGGKDDGPEAFFKLTPDGIAADASGRIYVLDMGNFNVEVFDSDGTHLRTMGREGEGPGEMLFPVALFVDASGDVRVTDLGRQVFVRFGADGSIADEVRLPTSVHRRPDARTTPMSDGRLVASVSDASDLRPGAPLRSRIVVYAPTETDDAWSEQVELAAIDWAQPVTFNPVGAASCPMKIRTPPVFTRMPVWHASPDVVLHNGTEEYVVDVTDLSGRRVNLRRDLPVVTATRELAAAEIGPMTGTRMGASCDISAEERADQATWLDRIPWIQEVARVPDGTILVRRRAPGQGPASRIDVFSPDGAYVGTLPPGFPFATAWRGPDEFLRLESDDMNRALVVIRRIDRTEG